LHDPIPRQARALTWPRREALVWAPAVAATAVLGLLLLAGGAGPALPVAHFYVVSGTAAVAFVISTLLAGAAVQAQHYKLLLLALGFMSMGGLFMVHGLATPGILTPAGEYSNPSVHSLTGTAGYLSLAIPSGFFAIGYSPLLRLYERRLPFWPAGGLLVVVLAGLVVFAALGFADNQALAELPLTQPPFLYGLGAVSAVLMLFAGRQQWLAYTREQLALQWALAMAFPLLALAQVAMVLAAPWSAGWWEYHVLMAVAVALALRTLALERVRGRSMRAILEAALDLEVRADIELEHVREIAALAAAIEAKDRNTRGHTARVADLTVNIARELNFPAPQLRYLARAGLLHDIGKLEIPDSILTKAGPLTDEEWVLMKRHPQMGVDILGRLGRFESEAEVVLHHHEREDGSGYPAGLAGSAIPLGARILAVADTYDVLVSDRPYRQARSPEEAVRILIEERERHLYAPAVDALLKLLETQIRDDRRKVPRVSG